MSSRLHRTPLSSVLFLVTSSRTTAEASRVNNACLLENPNKFHLPQDGGIPLIGLADRHIRQLRRPVVVLDGRSVSPKEFLCVLEAASRHRLGFLLMSGQAI